jgi:peptide/nickel transport system substrate-binding protein
MDPQKTGLAATSRILFQVLTPLVWKFPGDDTFYPGLAEKWDISKDGLTYTFYLRKDVKFHNGEPFNADSVKFTFDRMVDPEAKTLTKLPNYASSEKVDDYTVKVLFKELYAPFLALLSASVAYMPIPPKQAKEKPDEFGLTPAGTGPFKITEYVPKGYATLVKNPDYNWAPEAYFKRNGPAFLDQINWKIIEEPATRVATLQSGEIDMAEDIAGALVAQIEADQRFRMIYHDTLGCPRTVMLNCEKFPTDDKAVRQAMAYAVNKKTITEGVFKKTVEPRWGPIEPLTPTYTPEVEKYYQFDQEKAKSILEESGWKVNASTGIREKDGKPLKAKFIVVANDSFDDPAQVIQANFKEIGIDLELTTESEPTVFNTYNRGDQNLANIFWWGTDPESLYSLYHSSNIKAGFNWSHYSNPEVDKLLEEGQKVIDLEKRKPFYEKAQIMIMEDAAAIPIWGKRVIIGARKDLGAVDWSQNIYPLFYNTSLG